MKIRPAQLFRAFLLLLILALGLALRLHQNTVGLPGQYVPDEEAKVRTALTLPEHGFSHWESQPSFLYNSLFIIYTITDPFKEQLISWPRLAHRFTGPDSESAYYRWLGRCWMAILDTITIFFVYRLGKMLAGRRAGLFAALLYAVAPLPIAMTHYLKEDTPVTLFFMITLLMCLKLVHKGHSRDYTLAGLFAGFTFAAKYSGVLALGLVAGAIAIRHWPELRTAGHWKGWLSIMRRRIRRPLMLFVIGFFLICPSYLNLWHLAQGLIFQSDYMLGGHHDGVSVKPWEHFFTFYVRKALMPGLGGLTALFGLLSFYIVWKKRDRLALLPMGFAIGYLIVAELMPSKPYPFYGRYLSPILPVLCALAAYVLVRGAENLKKKAPVFAAVYVGFIGILMILLPARQTALFLIEARTDTRDLAREWVRKNIPKDAVIMLNTPRYTVVLKDGEYEMQRMYRKSWDLRRAQHQAAGKVVYAILSSFEYERYMENSHDNRKANRRYNMYSSVLENEDLIAEFRTVYPSFGYHNPTVKIFKMGPASDEAIAEMKAIAAGEQIDEDLDKDAFDTEPPFPERLPHD